MTTKRILIVVMLLSALLGASLLLGVGEKEKTTEMPSQVVIIGTFDSRAIALAYGSAHRAGRMPFLQYPKPIEFRQGFGTGDVSEQLDQIRDQIPKIAQKTGVDVIVSKWDIEYHDPNAVTLVDVTELLIQLFGPTKEEIKIIHDVMAAPPVPEKEIREREASGREL